MNFEQLQQQIEDAANRAMDASEEMRVIVMAAREQGFDVNAKLDITVQRCAPTPSVDWLESLYQIADRRGDRP
jgi:hypothetical protein